MSELRNPIDQSQLSRISEQIQLMDPAELIQPSDQDGLTPYRIAQIIRAALISMVDPADMSRLIHHIDRIAQSQRIYNIARSGKIDGIQQTHRIAEEPAERFIARYVGQALQQLKQL